MSLPNEPSTDEARRHLHDLNNLLTALIGHAETVSRALSPSDPARVSLKDMLDVLNRSSDTLRSLSHLLQGSGASDATVDVRDALQGSETVLFVEDEAVLRKVTARFVAMNGYRVLEALGAKEAIQCFDESNEAIDILVTDLTLPGMDGVELAQRLRARRPTLKVLYLSGHSEAEMRQRIGGGNHIHILPKPFRPRDLVEKIRRILDIPLTVLE